MDNQPSTPSFVALLEPEQLEIVVRYCREHGILPEGFVYQAIREKIRRDRC